MTQLDTPKSDYRERTGTEWLVLGLGLVVSDTKATENENNQN